MPEPRRPWRLLLWGVLAASLALNVRALPRPRERFVTATNANSRPTYFTMHRIDEARRLATGRGTKIGIIDHHFGFDEHRDLYAGGADFLDDASSFRKETDHGLWLATTAREIAPDAEIWALNATHSDDRRMVPAVVKAIDWAIAHRLDVVTYSNHPFPKELRPQVDAAVERATAAGVVVVFIHYTHPKNLLPYPMLLPSAEPFYDRPGDVNVLPYDYNVLDRARPAASRHLSFSSTSIVVGAVVAMLRQLDPSLTPAACKEILVATSRPYEEAAAASPEPIRSCPRVLDAFAAATRARRA